jgi:hypothetical protein
MITVYTVVIFVIVFTTFKATVCTTKLKDWRAEQVFEIVESDVKLREFRTALSDKNKINSSIFYYENIRKLLQNKTNMAGALHK